VFLPRIRADFQLNDSLFYGRVASLDLPITTINGAADPLIDPARVEEWRWYTRRRFHSAQVGGAHFCLQSHFREFLEVVNAELALLAESRPEPRP
jgi:surfactin synthase thioesterase subunit